MVIPRTPAGVDTQGIKDESYVCHPEYLDSDEILYELRIRNQAIPAQTRQRTAILSQLFHEERNNAVALTNCTIPSGVELRTCICKLERLAQMLEQNKMGEGFDIVFMSKYIHLKNRVERIDHHCDQHVSQTIFEIHENMAEIRQLFDTKWNDYVNRYRRNVVNDNSIHKPIQEIGSSSTNTGTTEHLVTMNKGTAANIVQGKFDNDSIPSAANIVQNKFGNNSIHSAANIVQDKFDNHSIPSVANFVQDNLGNGSIPTTASSNRSSANVPMNVAGRHMQTTTSSVGPTVVTTTATFNAPVSSHAVRFPILHVGEPEQYGDSMADLKTPTIEGRFSGITSTQCQGVNNANPPPQFNNRKNDMNFDIYVDSSRPSLDNNTRRSLSSDDGALLNQMINNDNLLQTVRPGIENETLNENILIINGKRYILDDLNPPIINKTYNVNNQFRTNNENNIPYNTQQYTNEFDNYDNGEQLNQNRFRNLRDSNSLYRLNMNNNNRANISQVNHPVQNTQSNEVHNYPVGTYGTNYYYANTHKSNHVPIFKWNLKFTGQPDKNGDKIANFVSFMQEVEFRRESSSISDRELFANIILLLDGPAKTWFMTHRNQFNNWQELRRAMENKFMGGATQHTFFMQIASRKQRVEESVSEYFADMLLKFSSVPDLHESRRISMIIGGLLPKFRNRALGIEWDSLNRLEDFLCDIEVGFNMDTKPLEPFKRFNRPQLIKPVHSIDLNEYDELDTHSSNNTELNEENGTKTLSVHAAQFVPQNNMKNNNNTRVQVSQNTRADLKEHEMVILNKSCYNCGENGHIFRACDKQRRSIYCRKCGMKNILVHTCKCPKEENEKNCSALACVNEVVLVSEEECLVTQY